jgi:HD-GYP domain-containing protein (c-di-GMP phosphodiesterase class II)
MDDTTKLSFKLKPETLKRCKVFKVDEANIARFIPINSELFHFLYEAPKIDFKIYFRIEDTMVEFIQANEFSKELLDQLWSSMEASKHKMDINILKGEHGRFTNLIESIREKKVNILLEKHPHLDRKTLAVFSNLSAASQMIVKGGLSSDVVAQVKASATNVVNNLLDSSMAISTLSKMITADPTLYDHSASVAMIATMIGSHCLPTPLPQRQLEVLARSGLYHDVGKTCVPTAILNKPGKFTPEEFEVMKGHAKFGESELLSVVENGAKIEMECVRVAGEHHEKFSGKGYPCGHCGRLEDDPTNGIHLYTRIVTIADVYSALLMKRVYKEAFEPQDAIKIMLETANNDYDPDIFKKFLHTVVKSLNMYEGKTEAGKGRILLLDDQGKLHQTKKGA